MVPIMCWPASCKSTMELARELFQSGLRQQMPNAEQDIQRLRPTAKPSRPGSPNKRFQPCVDCSLSPALWPASVPRIHIVTAVIRGADIPS